MRQSDQIYRAVAFCTGIGLLIYMTIRGEDYPYLIVAAIGLTGVEVARALASAIGTIGDILHELKAVKQPPITKPEPKEDEEE